MENHNTQVIILTEDMFRERKAAMSHDVVGTISKHCALNISSIYIIIKSLQFIFLSRLFNLYYYYVSTIYIIITSLQFILLLRLFNLYYYYVAAFFRGCSCFIVHNIKLFHNTYILFNSLNINYTSPPSSENYLLTPNHIET